MYSIPSHVWSSASICNSYLTPTLGRRLCRRWIEVFSNKIVAIELLAVAKLNLSSRHIIRQERMGSITLDDFFTGEPDRCERLIAALQFCSGLRFVNQEMISMDSWSSVRLQSRQIYCHGCSEFEFYLIVYSNCCQHVFKLAASKYEFLDSCIRVSGQKLVSRPIQETRNSFFPHLYHL